MFTISQVILKWDELKILPKVWNHPNNDKTMFFMLVFSCLLIDSIFIAQLIHIFTK